jgi:hypothetical protein
MASPQVAAPSADLPPGFTADPAELPAGFKVDEPAAKPAGFIETALRTVAQSAAPIIRTVGLAESTLQGAIRGKEAQDQVIARTEEQVKRLKEEYDWKPGETPNTAGEFVGGVASMPQQLLGQGVAPGVNRAAEVIERGGTGAEAATAGAATGAVAQLLQMLPMGAGKTIQKAVGGGAVRQTVTGAVGGAATNVVAGAAGRAVENAALPEAPSGDMGPPEEDKYADLRQAPLDAKAALTEAGVGAAFGALGVHQTRKAAAAHAKANPPPPPFPTDKMEDLGDGTFRTPNGSTITQEDWTTRSQKIRDGWMEPAPKEAETPKLQEEIDRLREEHPAGPVADVLVQVAKQRDETRQKKAQADELRAAADKTTDIEIKKALNAKADKLDPREQVPVGQTKEGQPEIKTEETKKIPVGETTEGQPEIKTEKTEPIPKGEVTEEKIPVGETNEVPGEGGQIPVGEAKEITGSGVEPTPEPKAGSIPKGEAKELYIPPEKRNAADQVTKQEGSGAEHQNGSGSGKATEASGGNRPEHPAEGGGRVGEERTSGPKKPGANEKTSLDVAGAGEAKGEGRVLTFPKIEESMLGAREPTVEGLPKGEDRGVTHARRTLNEGMREGTVHKDGGALALWALDRNPNLARGLRIEPKAKGDHALGLYDHAKRVIELFKGQNTRTAVHEIFHHAERMMPDFVQRSIRREWIKHVNDRIFETKDPKEKQALRDIIAASRGDNEAHGRLMDRFKDGTLDKDKWYHLTNPSEFWAVNAARLLHERHTSRGSWRSQAKQWMKEMVEHVKSAVGVRSDSAVLKGIDTVLNPKVVRSERSGAKMLADGGGSTPRKVPRDFQDVAGKPAKRELGDETRGERFVRSWTDRFNRVLKLQKTEAPKSEKADIYLHDVLFQGRAQHRGELLEKEHIKPLGKALEEAKKQDLTVTDADDYLTALHAPERNREIAKINPKLPDGGSGMTNKQAADILKGYTPEQKAALDKVAGIVRGMNKAKLDAMVADGLIKPELRDALNRKYKNYVPLKSLEDEDAHLGIGQGYSMRPNDIKEALGRRSRSSSPIAASMMDAARGIVRGEKARVDQSIWEYSQNKDAHDFIKPYDENKPPPEVMKNVKGSDGQVKSVVDPNKVRDYTLDLVVDGEPKKVFIPDQLLRDQLKKIAQTNDVGPRLAKIGKVTGTVGRMLTEFNPAFTVPNAVKDAITAGIRAKADGITPLKLLGGIPKAWGEITNYKLGRDTPGAKAYEEFLSAGGKTGAYGVTDLSETLKKLEHMGADISDTKHASGTIARKTKQAFGAAAHLMSNMNEVMEYATRFSAFKEARAVGKSVKESARIAKEITVNFNRSGEESRKLNAVLVFANAALQGARNTVVYAKHPAVVKGMLGLTALGAAAQAWNENMGGMDEDTGELNANTQSDVVADKNLSLMMPNSRSGLKIPMPPEYAFPFTLGRRLYRLFSQGNVGREATGIVGAALDAALPVRLPEIGPQGATLSSLKAVVPTPVAPLADLLTNTNYFGQPIVPDRHDTTSPAPYFRSSRRTTSEFAKDFSEALNTATGGDKIKPGGSEKYLGPIVSPEGMEYLVGYYTGGVGQIAMQSKNLVNAATKGEDLDINKVPIANRFAFQEAKSYTSRRYQELKPEFDYAIDYEKNDQSAKVDPKVMRALDAYKDSEHELRGLFKQLKGAEGNERTQVESDIKRAQSRVIRAYNGQPSQ